MLQVVIVVYKVCREYLLLVIVLVIAKLVTLQYFFSAHFSPHEYFVPLVHAPSPQLDIMYPAIGGLLYPASSSGPCGLQSPFQAVQDIFRSVNIQGGQKSVPLFSSNFSKLVKETNLNSPSERKSFEKLYGTQFVEKVQSN